MNLLLVEDDARVSRFVLKGLEADGHSVELADNGDFGFERACNEQFDVLVLDVMMPGRDGRQLCCDLRQAGIATPVLMLTARDQTEDKVAALREGADDYLTKPFDFDELLARLEALGRRATGFGAERNATLQIGELEIQREAMRVRYEGKPIELTAKEYELLELFVTNQEKVLSRTRILNKIWGYDSDPLTNVVDVYVNKLRFKFQWSPTNGWIKTVRSYGYRFNPK